MDCGADAKNMDHASQQEKKESVYFSSDTILEAVKFLNYEKWSKMRFLCHRFNQLIQSNQSNLQAFVVKSLSMEDVFACSSNSIVSFNQITQSADAVRKWFQDRGYSCDETMDMPLEKVFAGMDLFWLHALHFTFEASFEEPTENRRLSNAVTVRSKAPVVFSAEFNAEYEFYGPILSHFFRLLHHPDAYFREVSMFPPLTDKFCDMTSHSPIRCEQFTLRNLDSSLENSLKWLKDNVRAQNIRLSFNYCEEIPVSEFHSLVLEFLLDASICAKECITLDWLSDPIIFVSTLIEKYETMEITKTIPSIMIEYCSSEIEQYLESNLVLQDDSSVVDKFCDKCSVKTYQLQNKLDGNRKMIAQFSRCFERDCSYYGYIFRMRFD